MGHGASCMGWREGGVDAGRLRGRGWSVLNDEEDEEDEEERIDFCVASVKKKDLKQ